MGAPAHVHEWWLRRKCSAENTWTARWDTSVVPMAFWFFSMAGGVMTLVYGIAKREPVIILGQAFATVIYIRNIMLILKNHASGSKTLDS